MEEPDVLAVYPKWTILVARSAYKRIVQDLAVVLCADVRVDEKVPLSSCYINCEVGTGWGAWHTRNLYTLGQIQSIPAEEIGSELCLVVSNTVGSRMGAAVEESLRFHCIHTPDKEV